MSGFDIGKRHVGDGAPCLIVAEVAQAHEGSYGMAHSYIDAVAQAGADAVKFQCHIAAAESTPDEPWRVEPFYAQDESRYDYWKRMEFTPAQWSGLRMHAEERGLIFLCSPFSVQAVKMLDPLVPAWKVASGEVTNFALLEAIAKTSKPVILSSGMATREERRNALLHFTQFDFYSPVKAWRANRPFIPVVTLQCTSMYPTPAEKVGLGLIPTEFSGLSDHSGTIWPSLAAVTLGASIVEVHVCFSKAQFGFDVESSVTIDDLARMVEGVRFIEKAKRPVDKDAMAKELEPMRELFLRKHERKASVAG